MAKAPFCNKTMMTQKRPWSVVKITKVFSSNSSSRSLSSILPDVFSHHIWSCPSDPRLALKSFCQIFLLYAKKRMKSRTFPWQATAKWWNPDQALWASRKMRGIIVMFTWFAAPGLLSLFTVNNTYRLTVSRYQKNKADKSRKVPTEKTDPRCA